MGYADVVGVRRVGDEHPGPDNVVRMSANLGKRPEHDLDTTTGLSPGIRVDVTVWPDRCRTGDVHHIPDSHRPAEPVLRLERGTRGHVLTGHRTETTPACPLRS